MTVRTWMTISALVLVALTAAVILRLLAPVGIPGMLARSGDVRLQGTLVKGCWPQRGDNLRCEEGNATRPVAEAISNKGKLHIAVAYPVQPDPEMDDNGSFEIRDEDGEVVQRRGKWIDDIEYDLEPGAYELIAEAHYPLEAYVRYAFRFTIG